MAIEENNTMTYFTCQCNTESVDLSKQHCSELQRKISNGGCGAHKLSQEHTDFIFQVIMILSVGILGIMGNTGALYRFSRLKKPTKFHHLMMLISIYDLLCIVMMMLIFSLPRLSVIYKNSAFFHYFAPIALPILQVALTGSVYTTLAITLERYLIVCHPFYVVSHRWSSKRYIWPIVVFSLLYNIPKFFELYALSCIANKLIEGMPSNNKTAIISIEKISSSCNKHLTPTLDTVKQIPIEITQYFILPTILRVNSSYISIYAIWMNLIFMGIFPVLILIASNFRILHSLVRNLKTKPSSESQVQRPDSSHAVSKLGNNEQYKNKTTIFKRNRSMTAKEVKLAKVGLYIVLIFVICHSVKWVPNFYELVHQGTEEPKWVDVFMHISHFVIVFNCSVNFYIYCLTHLDIVEKIRLCFGKKANYVKKRCSDVTEFTSRRMSTMTITSSRKSSILASNSNASENCHKARLHNIMEEVKDSVTLPMLSFRQPLVPDDDDDDDDEW